MTRDELQNLLNSILANIEVIPKDEFVNEIASSYEIMRGIDPEDTAFIALAIAMNCDGIWSNDLDFERQKIVKIWKTHDLKKRVKIDE